MRKFSSLPSARVVIVHYKQFLHSIVPRNNQRASTRLIDGAGTLSSTFQLNALASCLQRSATIMLSYQSIVRRILDLRSRMTQSSGSSPFMAAQQVCSAMLAPVNSSLYPDCGTVRHAPARVGTRSLGQASGGVGGAREPEAVRTASVTYNRCFPCAGYCRRIG